MTPPLAISDAAIVGIIGGIPLILTAITTMIVTLRTSFKVQEVEKKVDGLSDKRDAATQKSAFAEGEKAESEKIAALELHKQVAFAEGKAQAAPTPSALPIPVVVENAEPVPVTVKKP